jgi:hypothetical protein
MTKQSGSLLSRRSTGSSPSGRAEIVEETDTEEIPPCPVRVQSGGRHRPRGIDGLALLAHILGETTANENGCLVPPQKPNGKGYTSTYYRGRHIGTHRLTYQLARGEVANDLQIDHRCRNRACCNPEHLEPVTPQENVRRGELHTNKDGRCGKCGGPLDSIRKSATHHGGIRRACKACQREANRDHYKRNRERILASKKRTA